METARHWRLQRHRYALVGEVCDHCGSKIFPARDVCPECALPAKTPFVFSGKGEVYSYATVHNPPEGFERSAPYVVALVRLAEGPLVAAQLTDMEGEAIAIGMPVEMVTRKLCEDGAKGTIVYGYKFRPVITPGPAR
ncbi:MAG: Zn-ribbon domain-containing OB-fold protein [Polyangia bacterium]|jgi:uncharacterized OB-fold protein